MGALQVGQMWVLVMHREQIRCPFLQHCTGAVRIVSRHTGHSKED